MIEPERATLSVVRGEGAAWRIDQIAGPGNAPVKPLTRLAVENWLGGCLVPF